jgi:hypothetical protein
MPENAHSQSAMFEDTIAVAEFPENPTEFPTTVGRPVNARFIKRFSHRHSVCLCIFYHVYEGFVVLVLGGASTPFFHGSQALSFSI